MEYNPYDTGYNAYEATKEEVQAQAQAQAQAQQGQIAGNDNPNEQIKIKIDKKGKHHEKNQSMNYGFIGSSSSTKYSNPYDNNAYGDFTSSPTTSKKEKRTSKKANKKRSSTEAIDRNSLPSDIDVTQAQVPVVYYTTPQPITTVPTVYYTTPVATPVGTPVAIQYVNSPNLAYQDGSNSSQSELNKEKRDSRKFTSYYGDKENAEEEVVKSEDKEKEYQEIMNELGIKPKDNKPKDLKSRLIRNQLTILISLLVLFVILVILYFIWPRVPDMTITEFALQDVNGIQYKLPMDIEYREDYNDLTNVTSSDVDSFVRFNLVTHFDVKNNNYLPYKFNSLVFDYVLKGESLKNNVLLGRSFVDNISFGARKKTHMTITTTLDYAAKSMKKDDTFNYILEKCGITGPGSKMDIDYKMSVKIPIIFINYHPSKTKTTPFECPFLTEDKFKVKEKKKEDKKHHHDDDDDDEDNEDDKNDNNDDNNDDNNNDKNQNNDNSNNGDGENQNQNNEN